MTQTFEQRIQSIEDQLKEIRKELEDSLALYKQREYPFTNGDISKFRSGAIGDTKCLWDSIPVEDRMKPMGLSCGCSRCTPYALYYSRIPSHSCSRVLCIRSLHRVWYSH